MAKIILGARPKTFSREIKFDMIDGTAGTMKVDFAYRTRKEFATFADGIQAAAKAEHDGEIAALEAAIAKGDELPPVTQAEVLARSTAYGVDFIMDSVKGWNLDVPFTRDAVEQLADEVPAAITALTNAYRLAITEGRAGN